ncbi:uncharacterized protein LY79DRAFT_254003 [Colletotrichum navitas]|uniref:Uncharacterized protein n=1 Tax=Colletotrichum navitas TaxID=681940 RepID=A0AAD8VB71_9PEZI|nr:uncharacterized protein LY79DRAFT_254003 [Colletotrichum navitas]KAK1598743.1 hypothetical protein LY79DRAFT_254003 [Colletotrichum navitas]
MSIHGPVPTFSRHEPRGLGWPCSDKAGTRSSRSRDQFQLARLYIIHSRRPVGRGVPKSGNDLPLLTLFFCYVQHHIREFARPAFGSQVDSNPPGTDGDHTCDRPSPDPGLLRVVAWYFSSNPTATGTEPSGDSSVAILVFQPRTASRELYCRPRAALLPIKARRYTPTLWARPIARGGEGGSGCDAADSRLVSSRHGETPWIKRTMP